MATSSQLLAPFLSGLLHPDGLSIIDLGERPHVLYDDEVKNRNPKCLAENHATKLTYTLVTQPLILHSFGTVFHDSATNIVSVTSLEPMTDAYVPDRKITLAISPSFVVIKQDSDTIDKHDPVAVASGVTATKQSRRFPKKDPKEESEKVSQTTTLAKSRDQQEYGIHVRKNPQTQYRSSDPANRRLVSVFGCPT